MPWPLPQGNRKAEAEPSPRSSFYPHQTKSIINKYTNIFRLLPSLLCCSLFLQSLAAQDRFERLSETNGFTQSITYAVAQDTFGNIWTATEEGVLRYNSQRTFAYRPAAGLPRGFGERVRTVYVAPDGTVWIGGERGFARYNHLRDEFEAMAKGQRPHPNLEKDLWQDETGRLWIAAFNGLWVYEDTSDRLQRVAEVRNIQCFQPGDKGQLLVGAGNGLYLLETATNEWSGPLKLGESSNYDVTSIASINGEYWLGTKNQGVVRLDKSLVVTEKLMETLPPVLSILPKPDGGVYVGTDGSGVLELDDSGMVMRHFSNDVNLANSLPSDGVYDLLLDREGLLWVATYGGGLAKLNPYANAFLHLDHLPNDEQSIAHPFTRAIMEDASGLVWFGTKDGLSIWNRSDGSWRHLPLSAGEEEKAIVMSLAEEEDFVWAGTYNKGLFKISKISLRIEPVTFLRGERDRRQGRIFSVEKGIPNGLWVGGINMDLYHLGNGGEVTTFPVSQVRDIFTKSEQEVWVAGRDGLARIRGAAAGAKVGFQEAMAANQETLDYSTLSFTQSSSKGLLVGTTGAGLLFGDDDGGLTGRLTEADGLPSNTVQSIAVESDERLWVATSRGLARITFSPQDTTIDVYTQADGLATTEFNYGSAARLRDGSLLFGGPEGVTYFNPAAINTATTPPSVILEDLLLLNQRQEPGGEVLDDHVNTLETLQLRHNQNALTLRFAGIAHAAGDNVIYRHQLKGLNKGWSLPSTSDQINYTNLDPGKYVFQVQAATSPEAWGPVKELSINISRPWYKSWWATLLYVLIAAVLLTVVYRVSQALIRRRNAEKQIDFFNNITHELKTPLAILLASLEEITEGDDAASSKATQKVRGTIKRLTALFEQLLNFHKASATGKSRHVKAFAPGNYLENLLARFSPMIEKRSLSMSVERSFAPDRFHYDTDIFDKIVYNLVSNAVKYSKAGGTIRVELAAINGGKLELKVIDDGLGIPADQQKYILREYYRARNVINSQLPGTGLGLMMVKSMVEKEGGSIRFVSRENEGTTFTVELEDREADLPKVAVVTLGADSLAPSSTLAPATAPAKPDTAGLESAQILLVEDNDELRASLAKRLGEHFRVITASDGQAGLEKARELFPDLIITDLIMPEMDGMELSRAVQADIQLNHIPIYMLTVLHNSAQKVESIEAGVTEYLEKPVNFELLLAKLTNTLSWRQKMRERYAQQDDIDTAAQHRTDRESAFITDLEQFTLGEIANDGLSVQDLCKHVGMSRTSLYMKLKNLVDLSPQDFIIHTRLKEARRLLTETDENVKEIAYRCGFSNPKYFSTSFKKKYEKSPVAFRKSLEKGAD